MYFVSCTHVICCRSVVFVLGEGDEPEEDGEHHVEDDVTVLAQRPDEPPRRRMLLRQPLAADLFSS
jgi:hypothetical protein